MYTPSKKMRLGVIAVSAAFVLAACGGGSDDSDSDGDAAASEGGSAAGMQLYFVDGNTTDYSKDFDPGTLEGVKATYPGPELSSEFQGRLDEQDPNLDSYTYGPESYDATVVSALAAETAGKDSGKAIAQQIAAVTTEGEKCTTYADCLELVQAGTDIDYDGVSGPIELGATGSPTAATIGIFEYQNDNTFEPMDYVEGDIPDTGEVAPDQEVTGSVPNGDGTFTVGMLLPASGDLAFLGPPEFAGVELAIKDINQAGGVLGKPAKSTRADSGDGTPNIAPQETDKLIRANSDVIIGAASSSVSLSVIDKITKAGVVHFSPANTSTEFDTYADGGMYFRTAPSDVLQGQVMASTLISDGKTNIAIMARQDSYGEALADNVEKFFTDQGGTVVSKQLYDPNAANFNAEIDAMKGEDPDAIVLIAFDETKKIIPAMVSAGVGQGQ
ncbi:ABC transporter substrate-binding protein [Nocardioides insulae]|uniref:ABC transporter substrate-binding protein n=1 Tax=Nocardioides insulae TaxID=394734 RepID=UPI00041CF116|nr:ABC transporter substrate-binding protein [Nocardioides insulae]